MPDRVWSMTARERAVADRVDRQWGQLLAEVDAGAADRDATRSAVPERFLTAAAVQGLQALPLPTHVGGEDVGPLVWTLVLETIGVRCRDGGFAMILGIRAAIAQALLEVARPDLVNRYAIPIARGTLPVALAYSEDADTHSWRTTLSGPPGKRVLSGRKTFVSGGLHAQAFLTYARSDHGDVVACMVHQDDPGVSVVPASPVGTRTSGPASIELDAVAIPEDRIVTAVDGQTHAQRLLNTRRLTACAAPLGQARALVELSASRLSTTIRQGASLADLPNVQGALGRMQIAVEGARALLYRAADLACEGHVDPLFDPMVSAAKHVAARAARTVLDEAQRVLGGHFYYGDPYFGTCLHDFAGLMTVAGTQDLLEINLGALASAQLREDQPRAKPDAPCDPGTPDPTSQHERLDIPT